MSNGRVGFVTFFLCCVQLVGLLYAGDTVSEKVFKATLAVGGSSLARLLFPNQYAWHRFNADPRSAFSSVAREGVLSYSPLLLNAVRCGDFETTQRLCSEDTAKRRVNDTDKRGKTALMIAAIMGRCDIIKELRRAGADDTFSTQGCKTAIMFALENSQYDAAFLFLSSRNMDVSVRDVEGKSLLMYACGFRGENAKRMVAYLVAHGADLDVQDKNGMTALMHAAVNNNADMIRSLLSVGADPDTETQARRALTLTSECRKVLVGRGAELFNTFLGSNALIGLRKERLLTIYTALIEKGFPEHLCRLIIEIGQKRRFLACFDAWDMAEKNGYVDLEPK